MLTFDAPLFAMAGLVAAGGPIVIHLLNRRQFRVVSWGAIEFLRQALERQRRALQLRDLLLLLLRILAVVGVGAALARPYLQGNTQTGLLSGGALLLLVLAASVSAAGCALARNVRERGIAGGIAVAALALMAGLTAWPVTSRGTSLTAQAGWREPVHAVVVIDNSRSMGVATAAGSRLERAQQLVRQFVSALPAGSRTTLIPAGGSLDPTPADAYGNHQELLSALEQIPLVDAADDLPLALELAEEACQRETDLNTKRVVLLSDLQNPQWERIDWAGWSQRLAGLQIAPITEGSVANIWIESLTLEDGIAGAESPCRFLARVRAESLPAATSVDAILEIDGTTAGSQLFELQSGQVRELEFTHQFEAGGEPGRPRWSTVSLTLRAEKAASDRLAADNTLAILAPVLDAVPVVFVDQFGDLEDPSRGRVGETYALRQLLAPRMANEEAPRRLIHVEHVRPDQVTTGLLNTARLVVVAGVETPDGLTDVLREYVVQGGPLVLMAGGDFNATAWQAAAWGEGHGLLPLPLLAEGLGKLPTAANDLEPIFVDFAVSPGSDLHIEGEDPEDLSAIFSSTPFFQAVRCDTSAESASQTQTSLQSFWKQELDFLNQQVRGQEDRLTPAAREHWRRLEPAWWSLRSPFPIYPPDLTPQQLVAREQPQFLAQFTLNKTPWIVQRRLGNGTALFFSSGVSSDWNLLRTSSAMYVFHRALSRLLAETIPQRNLTAGEPITYPLSAAKDSRWTLQRPRGIDSLLPVEALAGGVTGIRIRRTLNSGVYQLLSSASALDTTLPQPAGSPTNTVLPIAAWAVRGPESESILTPDPQTRVSQRLAEADIRLLNVGEPLRIEGGSRRLERLWTWGIGAVLIGLLAEMTILAAPHARREPA